MKIVTRLDQLLTIIIYIFNVDLKCSHYAFFLDITFHVVCNIAVCE